MQLAAIALVLSRICIMGSIIAVQNVTYIGAVPDCTNTVSRRIATVAVFWSPVDYCFPKMIQATTKFNVWWLGIRSSKIVLLRKALIEMYKRKFTHPAPAMPSYLSTTLTPTTLVKCATLLLPWTLVPNRLLDRMILHNAHRHWICFSVWIRYLRYVSLKSIPGGAELEGQFSRCCELRLNRQKACRSNNDGDANHLKYIIKM